MSSRALVALLTAIALALPLGGCHVLLLFPCLTMPCSTSMRSLPPRDDPFARALREHRDVNEIEGFLTMVSRTQYEALGGRWPRPLQCSDIAATGCRYAIPVRVEQTEGFAVKLRGCGVMDVAVFDGPGGAPTVRRSGYRETPCPEMPRPFTGLPE